MSSLCVDFSSNECRDEVRLGFRRRADRNDARTRGTRFEITREPQAIHGDTKSHGANIHAHAASQGKRDSKGKRRDLTREPDDDEDDDDARRCVIRCTLNTTTRRRVTRRRSLRNVYFYTDAHASRTHVSIPIQNSTHGNQDFPVTPCFIELCISRNHAKESRLKIITMRKV